MPKLNKNYYYSRTGERKVNCYVVNIPKEILQKSCIKEEDFIRVYEKVRVLTENFQLCMGWIKRIYHIH